MSLQADVFEPKIIRGILKGLEKTASARESFEKTWKENVDKRLKSWKKHKDNQSTKLFQLEWEAEVIEYVDYLYSRLSVHGNAKAKDVARTIDKAIPLLGPRFIPPSLFHQMRRDPTPAIDPQQMYIAALTIVHPVFYPTTFTNCPQCASAAILWDGWNATGARDVYGVRKNERAIGYQLRCKDCKSNKVPGEKYCFATTNHVFWDKWEHWKIPRSIPYFLKRAAVTHELFDMIIELRTSSTSAGIAENLKQLHLLEHRQRMLEYLLYFKSARQNPFKRNRLQKFSSPTDEDGYNDSFVTHDLITDLYLDFVAKVRRSESIEYCKTRTAKSISMDNTFKSAGKAALVDKDGQRQNPLKGGILSAINEEGEGLTWRFCTSNSPAEARELLEDIGKRHDAMEIARPTSVIVDNCCQVRRFVVQGLGPGTSVLLDVYHFMMRYGAVIYGGTKNPHRREVLLDIRDAIIKRPATTNIPALYWTQKEQETKIVDAYNKWLQNGNVWSAAASKVHADQLEHVRKGCLARPREDISMDGSRIEGTHKAWNSLQRAHPSGIEVYTALAHDFFLRRNIRVASARIENRRSVNFNEFVASTHASHHVQLVNHTAELFNLLYDKELPQSKATLAGTLPILPRIQVDEMIGLVKSAHSLTFGGLIEVKTEATDLDTTLLEDIDAEISEMDQTQFIKSLEVDERLISVRMARVSTSSTYESTANMIVPADPPRPSTSAATPEATLVSSKSSVPSQKRKDRADNLTQASNGTNGMPDSKRTRHTGPLSPSTVSLGLPTPILQEIESPEPNDSDLESPKPYVSFDDMALMDCEPTDAVVAAEVSLPSATSESGHAKTERNPPYAFFRFETTGSNSSRQEAVSQAPSTSSLALDRLRRPLTLPPALRDEGLTPSQLLFSLGTSIDPRALHITEDNEFYLFMDMRAEFQWTTFGMTVSKWASATSVYNERLEELGRKKMLKIIKKNPRALMDKLNEIEPKIRERLSTRNYKSKSSESGSETFWKKHCEAVTAIVDLENNNGTGDVTAQKKRKDAVCSRCKTVMYPGNRTQTHLNHKKGVCADGVASKLKPGSSDPLPDWPQPEGIFIEGRYFSPSTFLFTVRNLYERVIERTLHGNPDAIDYTLEDVAFSRMLESRTKLVDNHSFFLLYANLEFKGIQCDYVNH
ncbi:hypothetical protein BJ912DRAFT_1065323 [Pholiota molesta]|nr:hypothetical protein BJ912DRAFT_1065323 [Pholiota molesta]